MRKRYNKCKICNGRVTSFYSGLYDNRYGFKGKFSVARCKKCDYARTVPSLHKNKIANLYSKFYPLLETDAEQLEKNAKDELFYWKIWWRGLRHTAHLYIEKDTEVLDVGSGSGQSLLEITKRGAKAYGVEPDPNAQRLAKKLGLNVYEGFLTDNPFPNRKFDYITASQVIEHEPNPKEFLKTARAKLKNDGNIILSFPNISALYRKIFGRKWLHWHVPYHINFFSRESFYKLAKSADLEIVEIKTVTPNLWTLLQLRMLFYKSKEGVPNPIWTQAGKNKVENKARISEYLVFAGRPILEFFIAITNRIIDSVGWGESFVVFLKKNEK